MNAITYLDYAAATPLADEVRAAMQPYLSEKFYNPSAVYLAAKEVSRAIDEARARVAVIIGARPSEILFTAGGTEANNLAIQGVMREYPDANVLVSSIEHDSVLEPARLFDAKEIRVTPQGVVESDDLRYKIDDKTVLISVMYANNEIGTIQPLAQIGEIVKSVREERRSRGIKLPIYLHTDACQASNYLHLLADKLGVDMMTLNAGKLYGPKQSGALFVKSSVKLQPLILGGGQERGMRSGTESAANIIGFAAALESAQSKKADESRRLLLLRQLFIRLLEEQAPVARMTTSYRHTLPNNLHVKITGQDNERLMMALDENGIQCAVGSACSASSDEPSHVLKAIGLSDEEARTTLRFTMGRGTTEEDIRRTVDILAKLIV